MLSFSDETDNDKSVEEDFQGQLNYFLYDTGIFNRSDSPGRKIQTKSVQQFRCLGCARTYTRVDSLKRHQQKCEDYLMSLLQHDDNVKLEKLQSSQHRCDRCGKSYRRLDTLRRHQRLACYNPATTIDDAKK